MLADSLARHIKTSDEYWAEHYGKSVVFGLICNNLTPDRAGALARMAGSYGRRALAHREVVREGWSAIRQLGGVS